MSETPAYQHPSGAGVHPHVNIAPNPTFAAVDPFKASLAYSVQKVLPQNSNTANDLDSKPPPPACVYYPQIVGPYGQPYPYSQMQSVYTPSQTFPPGPSRTYNPYAQMRIIIQPSHPASAGIPEVVRDGSRRRSLSQSRHRATEEFSPSESLSYVSESRSASPSERRRRTPPVVTQAVRPVSHPSHSASPSRHSRSPSTRSRTPPIVIPPANSESRAYGQGPPVPVTIGRGEGSDSELGRYRSYRPRRSRTASRSQRGDSRSRSHSPMTRMRRSRSPRGAQPLVYKTCRPLPQAARSSDALRYSSSSASPIPNGGPRLVTAPPVACYPPTVYPTKSPTILRIKYPKRPLPSPTTRDYIYAFVVDVIPRQIYLHLLLRLPYLYFSRVTRIFKEADMTIPQIKRGILDAAMQDPLRAGTGWGWCETQNLPYGNLEKMWLHFIDCLLREWKTLNIISVLLLSAILTILQIDSAANDPITRFSALLSMICALMSLLYGCVYIIRFGTMRKTYKAAEWAMESQQTQLVIWWNVWVLLAMPATWLAWSMILYIVCIMSFVWRTGTTADTDRGIMSPSEARVPRVIVSVVFSLGLIYFGLIASTLRRYGDMMDQAWQRRIMGWMSDNTAYVYPQGSPSQVYPLSVAGSNSGSYPSVHTYNQRSTHPGGATTPPYLHGYRATALDGVSNYASTEVGPIGEEMHTRGRSEKVKAVAPQQVGMLSTERTSDPRDIKMHKLLGLAADDPFAKSIPHEDSLIACGLSKDKWEELVTAILSVWDRDKLENLTPILTHWNETFFREHGGQIALCNEMGSPPMNYAVYHFSSREALPRARPRYDSIGYLQRLDIHPLVTDDPENKLEPISLFSYHLKVNPSLQHASFEDLIAARDKARQARRKLSSEEGIGSMGELNSC